MPKKSTKTGLGRGLDSLFKTDIEPESPPIDGEIVTELKIMDIEPNGEQPRKSFNDEQLNQLAESIKEHGVITPILVHRSENGFYKIIAGERRWRASKLAGKKTIPSIIKDYDEMKVCEIALIENLQRQDLNPIEEALGYRKLMDDYSLTQEDIAKKISKSRSGIANSLRLLNLGKKCAQLLADGKISVGHAKVLLGVDDKNLRQAFADVIVSENLSVRELEKLVKKNKDNKENKQIKKKEDLNFRLAIEKTEKKISDLFATKVKISNNNGKGKITIDYYSNDDLERIVKIIESTNK